MSEGSEENRLEYELLEDELLEALEQELDKEDDDTTFAGTAEYRASVSNFTTLYCLGDDLLLRIMSMLSVAHLCTLSGACRWARRSARRDELWKSLYFERWADPCSHHQEREGSRLGWKQVYENKDNAGRAHEQHEEAMRSEQDQEDEETQEAFRAMHAAQRSQALQKKHSELDSVKRRSAIEAIHDAILEFKSHIRFPHTPDARMLAGREGDAVVSVSAGTDSKRREGEGPSMFGLGGFYTSYTAGHLRNFLSSKLSALPHKHQLEVCVCKLTGCVHLCSRDSGQRGCELAQPNDDGFFVCPVTGIIWDTSRQMAGEEQEEQDDLVGDAGDFEGGSKSFCNMVRQGYECDLDPSAEMGWGSWLEDRAPENSGSKFRMGTEGCKEGARYGFQKPGRR